MRVVTAKEAAEPLKCGMSIMIGGFLHNGRGMKIIDEIVAKGLKDLTIITNDPGQPDVGVGRLLTAGCVKKLICTHVGLNPDAAALFNAGKLEIELVPQGSFAEKIRAAGAGLGGVLTPTGLGTEVADGKDIIVVDGREYLLEKPLRADAAILHAAIGDKFGNLYYKGTTRNFNIPMAMAADIVIAECEELVETGGIAPEDVMTSGIFIDYLVEVGK